MDFGTFRIMSFDCYGTLVDWETGILTALRPVLEAHGKRVSDDDVLELFGAIEPQVQSGEFLPYAEVLRRVMDGVGERSGFEPTVRERNALVDSIGDWPVFPDTASSLRELKSYYRLYILSNVDDDLFARTAPGLGVEMDGIITAQQLRSYKPAPAHFTALLERTGALPSSVVHVAQSLFHDIGTAKSLGFGTVWVNRRGDRAGAGATPLSVARPDLEVSDLASLAALVSQAFRG